MELFFLIISLVLLQPSSLQRPPMDKSFPPLQRCARVRNHTVWTLIPPNCHATNMNSLLLLFQITACSLATRAPFAHNTQPLLRHSAERSLVGPQTHSFVSSCYRFLPARSVSSEVGEVRSKWNGVSRLGNRFVSFRASGRGEAAWAGGRIDPSVAREKSRQARRVVIFAPHSPRLAFIGHRDCVPVSSGVSQSHQSHQDLQSLFIVVFRQIAHVAVCANLLQ